MLKTLLFLAFIVVANAGGYGRSGGVSIKSGSGGGNGGSGSKSVSSGGVLLLGGRSGSEFSGGIISAAIQSIHNIEFRDVPISRDVKSATIEVGASQIPLSIIFKSASSNLNVLQQHEGAGGDKQESSSEDEPHRLFHTVRKPIVQEVREVISPLRKIVQQIEPVQEEIQTIVARGTAGTADTGAVRSVGSVGKLNTGGFGGKKTIEMKSIASGTKSGLGLGLVGKIAKELEKEVNDLGGTTISGGYKA